LVCPVSADLEGLEADLVVSDTPVSILYFKSINYILKFVIFQKTKFLFKISSKLR
jgi:hypothetical protein